MPVQAPVEDEAGPLKRLPRSTRVAGIQQTKANAIVWHKTPADHNARHEVR